MKKVIILFLLLTISMPCFAYKKVKGYFRKNGTYVHSYYRSSPDGFKYNNFSTKGNIIYFTGKKCYKKYWKTYK